ncbi:hypothetical protein predicted by Glimmer/Critica (plasmid) [Sinorhizobium fredii HH103]|uniref:Uncharacterized protein n=1 Tax=Sinorhizobium fredii (strain HH103) TaxID=1117943 RepID=G9AGR8_SINF1|nr:hypothetical protein predicted by Glimmer/Critica [Sinorhizobium fredii HH103]
MIDPPRLERKTARIFPDPALAAVISTQPND